MFPATSLKLSGDFKSGQSPYLPSGVQSKTDPCRVVCLALLRRLRLARHLEEEPVDDPPLDRLNLLWADPVSPEDWLVSLSEGSLELKDPLEPEPECPVCSGVAV